MDGIQRQFLDLTSFKLTGVCDSALRWHECHRDLAIHAFSSSAGNPLPGRRPQGFIPAMRNAYRLASATHSNHGE
jgi:hypothetical protein